jgi:hypothetical protein
MYILMMLLRLLPIVCSSKFWLLLMGLDKHHLTYLDLDGVSSSSGCDCKDMVEFCLPPKVWILVRCILGDKLLLFLQSLALLLQVEW